MEHVQRKHPDVLARTQQPSCVYHRGTEIGKLEILSNLHQNIQDFSYAGQMTFLWKNTGMHNMLPSPGKPPPPRKKKRN